MAMAMVAAVKMPGCGVLRDAPLRETNNSKIYIPLASLVVVFSSTEAMGMVMPSKSTEVILQQLARVG